MTSKKDKKQKKLPSSWVASFVGKIKKAWKKGGVQEVLAAKEIWIGVGALALVAVIILLSVFATAVRVSDVGEEIVDVVLGEDPRHPLTGEVIEEAYDELPQVFGVMVENSYEAWPLEGLDEAFLVIEAPVEAGIPRFIAFYSEEDEVEEIGPVRSARPYYVDWNDGLQAIYAHVGGSPEALELIRDEYDTLDLNQFWFSQYFYRENGYRFAPHNVFTTAELLIEAMDEFDLDEPSYELWSFADDEPTQDDPVSFTVDFADGTTYDPEWEYDEETNAYVRSQGENVGTFHKGEIVANNVVIMATDIRSIDNEDRKSVETVGEGDALIAQNGGLFLARWVQEDRDDRLKFYTSDGYEISFNAGSTWVEIVSSLGQVVTD